MLGYGKVSLLLAALAICACGQIKPEGPQPAAAPAPTATAKTVPAEQKLTIRYIANQGVLISLGDRKVLIDAIHQKYKPAYLFPPPELLAALETAAAPYDGVDLILVTHTHLDHFHAGSVGLHLKNDPRSVLVSSAQVRDEMAKDGETFSKIGSRVKDSTPAPGTRVDMEINGIKFAALGLKHINPQHSGIQNLGYLVEIGGRKILHVGDAELTEQNFAPLRLDKESIDVAILPQWFLEQQGGCASARKLIGAKSLIATHIAAGHTAETAARVKQSCPGSDAFTTMLEERTY